MHTVQDLLYVFNFVGSIAFMVAGAMAAIKRNLDLAGAFVLSTVTGVGGGTIRDILVNRKIFWMESNWYIYLAMACTLFVFLMHRMLPNWLGSHSFHRILAYIDALGLVPFMLAGISVGIMTEQTDLVAVMLGLVTCVGGGVIRDLLCSDIPIIFREDLYATSVLLGSIVYLVLAPLDTFVAFYCSGLCILLLRIFSIQYRLHLPKT